MTNCKCWMDSVLLYQSNLQATSSNAQSYKSRKKKSQFGKVTFQKSQTLNLPERLKYIVFFKKFFQTDGPFCTIFPFLAHYGIFMISSILHVTWNYILLILCASLSLYTLLTWRKTAASWEDPTYPGLFIVWVPKAKAKYPMKSQMCNKNIIFND